MWNSLHGTNGKYENPNRMKSQLQYITTTQHIAAAVA